MRRNIHFKASSVQRIRWLGYEEEKYVPSSTRQYITNKRKKSK